jgi:hypothetical protein
VDKGSKRFFYTSLLPVAYRMWRFSPPMPANARDFNCKVISYHPHLFENSPDNGQERQITGFGATGDPNKTLVALARHLDGSGRTHPYLTPSSGLLAPLLEPATPNPDDRGLGLTKTELISSRYFAYQEGVSLVNDSACPALN